MPASRDLLSAGIWVLLAGIWILICLFLLGVPLSGSSGGLLIIALCAPGFAFIIAGENQPAQGTPRLYAAMITTAAVLVGVFLTHPKEIQPPAAGIKRCADSSFGRFCD